nr:zinc ribbon domain-containing protein [Prevotella sp.]
MKKCICCGAQLEEDSVFCSYCGKKIEFRSCSYCGAKLEDDSIFCSKCGMRLQDTLEETPPHDAEIQEIDNTPKKSYSTWYVTCCIVIVFVLIGGFYALSYLKNSSTKETNTTAKVNCEMKLSLIGDADGFPLKLTLSIINENVTGIYKNVNYGTTMTVRGTMVGNIICIEGAADHTN